MSAEAGCGVEVQSLSKTLGGVPVLRDLNLRVTPGDLALVWGPSGCGKSTLLHILAGFLSADTGRVEVHGQAINDLDAPGLARLRREDVAVMTQDFHLLKELTAVRNAALPLLLAGRSASVALAEAEAVLESLGLSSQRNARTANLSRGQRQRVALARALVLPRPVLLLDEPTSSLDATSRDQVIELLAGIAQSRGATVLVTSHDRALGRVAQSQFELREGALTNQVAT